MQGGRKMKELTIKEAAAYYGKSESWIRKKILNGQLAANKEEFTYGQRWITTEKALDQLAEDLKEQAKIQKDSINIREVSKPVAADELINKLLEQLKGQNKELIDEAAGEIKGTIKEQQETINQLTDEVDQVQQQNINKVDQAAGEIKKDFEEKFNQQQELIKKLSDQVEEMQQRQNKSFIDKLKDFFK